MFEILDGVLLKSMVDDAVQKEHGEHDFTERMASCEEFIEVIGVGSHKLFVEKEHQVTQGAKEGKFG